MSLQEVPTDDQIMDFQNKIIELLRSRQGVDSMNQTFWNNYTKQFYQNPSTRREIIRAVLDEIIEVPLVRSLQPVRDALEEKKINLPDFVWEEIERDYKPQTKDEIDKFVALAVKRAQDYMELEQELKERVRNFYYKTRYFIVFFPVIQAILLLIQGTVLYKLRTQYPILKGILLSAISAITISTLILVYNCMYIVFSAYKRQILTLPITVFIRLNYFLSVPMLLYSIILSAISIEYHAQIESISVLSISILLLIVYIWFHPKIFKYTERVTPKLFRILKYN